MSEIIVKVRDQYIIWSTIVDAPTWGPGDAAALRDHLVAEAARQAEESLRESLKRLEAHGSSSVRKRTPDEIMWLNRAGRNGGALTKAQLEAWLFGEIKPRPSGAKLYHADIADDWTIEKYLGKAPRR